MNPNKTLQDQAKALAATKFIDKVLSIYDREYHGSDKLMLIGLGTGSTVNPGLHVLGKHYREKRIQNIKAMSTSKQTSEIAASYHIPLIELNADVRLRIGGDGADFLDNVILREKKMAYAIKGGGRAQGDERTMASKCKEWIIIADKSKLTRGTDGKARRLGETDWVPIEVPEKNRHALKEELLKNGAVLLVDPAELPTASDNSIVQEFIQRNPRKAADNGHPVIEAHFPKVDDETEAFLDSLKRKFDIRHGLFFGLADQVILASIGSSGSPEIEEIRCQRRGKS